MSDQHTPLTLHAGGVDRDAPLRATRDAERALRELAAAQPASDLYEAIVGLADLLLLRLSRAENSGHLPVGPRGAA